MSVQNNIAGGESVVLERPAVGGVYASLFEKINLNPVSELSALDIWQDAQAMTGTNGQLPRKALESTLLDRVVKTGKVPVRVLNVTAPTMPLYPPANDRFHWRVMSHLGSNFLSMMDNPEVLRGTLALYDWTDDEMNRRRLEAIVAVKHTLIRRFEKGFMLRGVDIEVTLNMDNFAGEGDVNLFGEMLHRFFALYADVHLFNQLTLVLQPTGKRLRWCENHSQHVPG